MREREKDIVPEIPKEWKACIVKVADAEIEDIKSEIAAIKKCMEIADFFATKHGIVAKSDGKKVILEARPNAANREMSTMEAINGDLQKMISEGTLILFSVG